MRKERAEKFLERVKEGKTYDEIGEEFNLTKTTVYSDLKEFFPKETRKALDEVGFYKGKYANVKKRDFEVIECPNCGKKQKSTKYRYYKPVFCSKECHQDFLKKQWAKVRNENPAKEKKVTKSS